MKAYPFTSTTTTTMRQNCGGSLMFNMYLSGIHSLFVRKMRKIAEMTEKKRAMLRVCGCMLRSSAGVSDFSIWNACPLLSEIGYPFSWTRFLTSALKSGQLHRAETRRYSYYLTSFIANCYL